MRVTGQEGYTGSSVQCIFLESFNELITLSLEKSYELKPGVRYKNAHHVAFGRPMVILSKEISSERKERRKE